MTTAKISKSVQQVIMWLLAIFCLSVAYDYLAPILRDLDHSKFHANEEYNSIVYRKSADGHFRVQLRINNQSIVFLLDTGASDIVMSLADAKKVHLDLRKFEQVKIYETANGNVQAKVITIPEIQIASLTLRNVKVSVNPAQKTSLLGMSFLQYFDFSIVNNQLVLKPNNNFHTY